jgi:hypothetical protein
MHEITLVSTIHNENGLCNALELSKILYGINPSVVFLEAHYDTYSKYQRYNYKTFGVHHEKLEISAIQHLSKILQFQYVPVLESALNESFDKKVEITSSFAEIKKLLIDYRLLEKTSGFQFVNSKMSDHLQKLIRAKETEVLNNPEIDAAALESIDKYENSMMDNIYKYCSENDFDKAVFMCGVAHRKSLISKMESYNEKSRITINWKVFESDL